MIDSDWLNHRERHSAFAQKQAFHLRIDPLVEARAIAASCGLDPVSPSPDGLADAALSLFPYPSPSSYLVTQAFRQSAKGSEAAVFQELIRTVGRINKVFRTNSGGAQSTVARRPELEKPIASKDEAIERAAILLADHLVLSTASLDEARALFRELSADTEVKAHVLTVLRRVNDCFPREFLR